MTAVCIILPSLCAIFVLKKLSELVEISRCSDKCIFAVFLSVSTYTASFLLSLLNIFFTWQFGLSGSYREKT